MRFLSILQPALAARAVLVLVLAFALPSVVSAQARDCRTDPQTFSFLPQPAQTLHAGTREEVSRIYGMLAETLSDLGTYPRTTLFLTRDFETLTLRYCGDAGCTPDELSAALRTCARGGKSPNPTCYPLAAIHEGALYCLLSPADVNPTAPFAPFAPFGD